MEHYSDLRLVTKETSNGWWPHYATNLGKVYIHHKLQEGSIDLTFPHAAEGKMPFLKQAETWLKENGVEGVQAISIGKAGSLRFNVHKFKTKEGKEGFENEKEELDDCFEKIKQLADFADMVAMVAKTAEMF